MPTPSDFGIDYTAWLDYQREETMSAGHAQVAAYQLALQAWKEVAIAVAKQLDERRWHSVE